MLEIELSDTRHQNCNVLVGLAHFALVLRVLSLVVGHLSGRLNLDSVGKLLQLSAPLNHLLSLCLSHVELLFIVLLHIRHFLSQLDQFKLSPLGLISVALSLALLAALRVGSQLCDFIMQGTQLMLLHFQLILH